ncbi:MAG: hypothetical protein Q8K87_04030 [Hydrogenophaga sp.]|nr:hypothetical protein [Hydrogenophaga sp.]
MFRLDDTLTVYLHRPAIDFRMGINGLGIGGAGPGDEPVRQGGVRVVGRQSKCDSRHSATTGGR